MVATKRKLPKSYLAAIETIKNKGFSHIKVELEAQLDRGDGDERDCYDCNGSGWARCSDCDNRGYINTEGTEDGQIECQYCVGEGETECDECNGRGTNDNDSWDTDSCEQFIIDRLSPEARNALTYYNFYDDGSVDSEITFTLPSDKAHHALEVMAAFKALADEVGNGLNTENAGMHLSLLPDGKYPCERGLLNRSFMANFRREVVKLLPALYFVASHDANTRGLEYRKPQVSADDKYSAIFTHGDTCMEFRIFDTCYDQPDSLLEKIEIMSKTLRFYSASKLKIGYKDFEFVDANDMADKYRTPKAYDVLHEALPVVKPSKSVDRLKLERGYTFKKRELVSELKSLLANKRAEYDKYLIEMKNQNERQMMRYFNDWQSQQHYRPSELPVEALRDYDTFTKFMTEWSEYPNFFEKPYSFEQYASRGAYRSGQLVTFA